MATRQQFVVFAVAIAVLLSGCAGWGTDSPEDDLDESEPGQADASNESGAGESNESTGDGSDATANASDSDSEATENDSDGYSDHESDNDSDGTNQNQTESGDGTDEKKLDENERESNTHTLSVTVTDPDEQPIEGATVELSTYPDGEKIATATTDENGVAEFAVEPGDYEAVVDTEPLPYTDYGTHPIEVSDSDESYAVELAHPPDSDSGDNDTDSDDNGADNGAKGGDKTNTDRKNNDENGTDGGENETNGEPATQTLTVTIIDNTNAGPMQGTATVNGETKEVPGDRGAQFEVENETYTVTGETSEDGWHVVSEEVTVDGDDTKVTLIAQPIHTLTVDTGEPGVDVTLTGPAADEAETKTTGDDGYVEFEVLPGDYSVTADGYESADVTVPVEYEPVPVELTPKTTDPPTHTLTVTVTDATGDPVENASVNVVTYDGGADVADGTTDENGEVTFDLEDGSYELAVSAEGLMQPSDQRLVEINGGDTAAEVQLQETGGGDDTATGIVRVTDSDGNPIEGEPVKITPPATVTERGTEIEYTDENGELVIELSAGEPEDVVMYGVEVRGEEQTLAIMSNEHAGVQVVEFQPTDRMYLFETVIYVTDESGEPVEGVPVEARHGLLGDDPANEWELVGETDENGEVVLTGGSSIPDDVIAKEVRVGDQEPFTTYVEADKRVEEVTINQSDDPAQNGAATNETDAGTPATAAASPPAVPAG
ncbi:carboxypeptidase regulatory-like domain-containing protein [Halalkalicoccus salilacus]|uniref:carboxypeptidase regulatory-like domain-containing protein n=1 Tax=Halalkalicoccus salilacus TaxID=3117459 RepID=UPI00300EEE75